MQYFGIKKWPFKANLLLSPATNSGHFPLRWKNGGAFWKKLERFLRKTLINSLKKWVN